MDKSFIPNQDTIAAISTAQGQGGIAVIRISGPQAADIIQNIFLTDHNIVPEAMDSHRLYHGHIKDPDTGDLVDEALCTLMKSPNSYTGENVAEIHSHGGYLVPRKILELVLRQGARPSGPGEFSLRAFLNGRIDLAQAEAVTDIINAQTEEGLKQAEMQLEGVLSDKISIFKDAVLDLLAEIESQVDFPEEDIDPIRKDDIVMRTEGLIDDISYLLATYDEGRIIKYGVTTTILGKPNVGKSSLLNSLLMKERAIVSHEPGTTRDFIEESIDIRGIPLKLIDTAGIRCTTDNIEKAGIELAKKKAREGELLIAVIDGSTGLNNDDFEVLREIKDRNAILVINKTDLGLSVSGDDVSDFISEQRVAKTSVKEGIGIEELKDTIQNILMSGKNYSKPGEIVLTELRHKSALEKSMDSLSAFLKTFKSGESPEFAALDLRVALNSLGEITGEVTTEDVLGRIFSKFCVGK